MKRFYAEATAVAVDGGFGVALDDQPLRTPAKAALIVPSRALADAIAAEWRGQGEDVRIDALPLTRLASTAIDLVAPRRPEVIAETARYAGTDLVCYRAAHPPELAARQNEIWQPLIDWATLRYDAPLEVTSGVVPVSQAPASLRAFTRAIEAYTALPLAALQIATAAAGSLVIALALIEGRLDVEGAFAAAQFDETWGIELWGEDPELSWRRAEIKAELALAARFIGLLQHPDPEPRLVNPAL
jgi:chaperone required for assembly of F1-ATPase